MKILHITNAYPTENDKDYGVFVKEQIDSMDKLVDQEVYFINGRDIGWKAYFSYPSKKSITSADVIHCHHVFSLLASFPWLILYRKPVMLSFLNQFENEIKFPIPNLAKILICRFAVFMSDLFIFKATPNFEHKKLVYLPNGVNLNEFDVTKQKVINNHKIKKIFFVSSKNPNRKQKRIDIFKDVVEILQERYGLQIDAYIASGLDRIDYIRELSSSDLHLLCSDYEGSPNSVKEAMALNIPVLSTNVGNVKEMFSKSDSSFYKVSDSNDPKILAKIANQMLSNENRKQNDGVGLIKLNKLSIDAVAEQLVNIYSKLLK